MSESTLLLLVVMIVAAAAVYHARVHVSFRLAQKVYDIHPKLSKSGS
jgi:hypothetical protein